MKRLLRISPLRAWLVYTALDVLCMGVGMGVPIFCILLGLPVGWYLVQRLCDRGLKLGPVLRQVWRYAIATAVVTLAGMVLIWGRTVSLLFKPGFDLANFGMPLILFEPRASFIGWLVLMMIISPFLQLLMTLFAAHWTLLRRLPGRT
jgi:hypothetical protein